MSPLEVGSEAGRCPHGHGPLRVYDLTGARALVECQTCRYETSVSRESVAQQVLDPRDRGDYDF